MRKFFPSKIFIDGGLPQETRQANEILLQKFGRPLDGQTTNPTLIARNLAIRSDLLKKASEASRLGEQNETSETSETRSDLFKKNKKITQQLAVREYKHIVQQMSKIIHQGSISIQVFANQKTKADEMIKQARERTKWIANASIKLPCTFEGLKAAENVCQEFPINITLVFSQSQAAAVYEATKKAKYSVFISPFVGRLDDRGENGMDVVKNILKMFENSDHHVQVLTASVRSIDHFLFALKLKSDIITVPFKIFKEWAGSGFQLPDISYQYKPANLHPIPYRDDIKLGHSWQSYDLSHDLTDRGITSFWNDWMALFAK